MPPLSAYTPFESLLFFQCLASLNNAPSNFTAISDTLRKNQFIKEDAAFDTNRLSPQALEELYTRLLQEGLDESLSVGDKSGGQLHDGGAANPKKRKINGGSIAPPHLHTTVVPEVVSQLYARYKDRVTKEIREEEKRYRDISEEIKKLEKDAVEEPAASALQEKKGLGDLTGVAVAPPTNDKMDIDLQEEIKKPEIAAPIIAKPLDQHPIGLRARPTVSSHETAEPVVPLPSKTYSIPPRSDQKPLAEDINKQVAPPPAMNIPSAIAQAQQQPQAQLISQQAHTPSPSASQLPPSTPSTPSLKASVNEKDIPLALQPPSMPQPSPNIQVKAPPPQQQPQRLTPQAVPRTVAPAPVNRGQTNLPPGSTIVFQAQQATNIPITPTVQRHIQSGESTFSKATPVPTGSPMVSQLPPGQMAFQQWPAHPVPATAAAAVLGTPNAQQPSGTQPIRNRPMMPKQGNSVAQPDVTVKSSPSVASGYVPVTPAPLRNATQTPLAQSQTRMQPLTPTTPFAGTPSVSADVKPRPPRPSMDTAGSLTPWKRTPVLHIDIPDTPGSPPRPKPEDISPISERALSPTVSAQAVAKESSLQKKRGQAETEKPRRGRKQSLPPAATEGVASKIEKSAGMLGTKRANSTTSTRSRARSVASHDGESTTESAVTTQRKIKHEAPSTPAGISEDVDVETRTSTRRSKTTTTTSIREEGIAQAKTRPKRKRGASEALEADTTQPTPTHAVSSQLVYCTRNFARTGAPIMNDVAAHKHASIFAKPLTEREAPGYRDLIYRPQDLKSIKSALSQGNKAIAAATEAVTATEGESPNPAATSGGGGTPTTHKNTAWLTKTPELIPPKAIVNSSQLEKELIRMFANAVMFNPAPDRERGFGASFTIRKQNESRPSSSPQLQPWELDEGGITRDTREMCDDVEKAVTKWRAAERTTTNTTMEDKTVLSLRGSSGDSTADGTDADIK